MKSFGNLFSMVTNGWLRKHFKLTRTSMFGPKSQVQGDPILPKAQFNYPTKVYEVGCAADFLQLANYSKVRLYFYGPFSADRTQLPIVSDWIFWCCFNRKMGRKKLLLMKIKKNCVFTTCPVTKNSFRNLYF